VLKAIRGGRFSIAVSVQFPVRYVLHDLSRYSSRTYSGQNPHPDHDGSYSDAGRTSESFGEEHVCPDRRQGGKQGRDDGGYRYVLPGAKSQGSKAGYLADRGGRHGYDRGVRSGRRRRGGGQNVVSLIRYSRAGRGALLLQGAAEDEAAAEEASHR
jgi:hypothetical protein